MDNRKVDDGRFSPAEMINHRVNAELSGYSHAFKVVDRLKAEEREEEQKRCAAEERTT